MFSGFFGTQHFFQGTARVLGCVVSMCVTVCFVKGGCFVKRSKVIIDKKLPWDTCLLLHEVI